MSVTIVEPGPRRRRRSLPPRPAVAMSLAGILLLIIVSDGFPSARRSGAVLEEVRRMRAEAEALGEAGNFIGAEALLERILSVLERSVGVESREYARALLELAQQHYERADDAGCRWRLERSLSILELVEGPESRELYQPLMFLAGVLTDLGDWEKGRAHYARGVALSRKNNDGSEGYLALMLTGLARCHMHDKKFDLARPLLDEAVSLARGPRGGRRPLIYILQKLFWNQLAAGDAAAALASAQEAYDLVIAESGIDSPGSANVRRDLATVLLARREWAASLDHSLLLEEIQRRTLSSVARTLSERQALVMERYWVSGLDLVLSAVAGSGSRLDRASIRKAWEAVVASRGMVLDEMAYRNRVLLASGDPEAARLLDRLHAARARLSRILVTSPGSHEDLEHARAEMESCENALGGRSTEFRRRLIGRRTTLLQVEAAMPAGGGIAAYVKYDRLTPERPFDPIPSYLAFVLAPDGGPKVVDLGDAGPIDSLVRRWRRAVADAGPEAHGASDEADYRRMAGRLRETVWDPVQEALGRRDLVLIVPDGDLGLVNFATLPTGTGRYLIDEKSVLHIVSAERDLVDDGSRGSPGSGLLALGGPEFDASPRAAEESMAGALGTVRARPDGDAIALYRGHAPDWAGLRTLRFPPLTRAREEIEEIEAIWKTGSRAARGEPTTELTGIQASEGVFKRLAPGHRVVHVATHGIAIAQGSSDARADVEVPAPGGGDPPAAEGSNGADGRGTEGELSGNALTLSAIALAGANRRQEAGPDEEDGILSSQELASIDLRGAEWVVLSGCETGTGEVVPREGVFGLRRAVRIAGARTLIASLWKVKDDDALEWMRRLYRARAAGASTASSVWSAEREVLRARRARGIGSHPHFWGAFVAAGDWR